MLTFLVFAATILVLVGIHEGGHFLVARAFGVYIKEFAIGFGPKLFSIPGKETKYTLRLIPFGGYVRMAGEDREETDESIPCDRTLYSKPPYARALISLAGPVFNLLLALTVIMIVVWSTAFPVMQVSEIIPDSPASRALEFGDRVLRIDGHLILTSADVSRAVQRSGGEAVEVELIRDGQATTRSIVPEYVEDEARYVLGAYFYIAAYTNEVKDLEEGSALSEAGLQASDRITAVNNTPVQTLVGVLVALDDLGTEPVSLRVERDGVDSTIDLAEHASDALAFFDAASFVDLGMETHHAGFANGFSIAATQFVAYIEALANLVRGLISGQVAAGDAIQGPIGIAQLLGESLHIGASYFFQLLAFLSLNFGLLNLIPFPALDGSRATFALYEWIRGKPIRPEREGLIHAIGFLILIGLMILITYRDLARLFG